MTIRVIARKNVYCPLIAFQDRADSFNEGWVKGAIIMEIKSTTSVEAIRSAANQAQSDPVSRPTPSVSVSTADTSRMADLARAAQSNAETLRIVRLAHIEKSIRAGNYQPSASQIANRLLDAAEIDDHLHAVQL